MNRHPVRLVGIPPEPDRALRPEGETLVLPWSGLAPGSLLLDFGVEDFGKVIVTVVGEVPEGGGRICVQLGESVSEAQLDPDLGSGVPIEVGLRVKTRVSGFRFARITTDPPQGGLAVHVTARSRARDVPITGSFRCSDPSLDQIWTIGARTAALCTHDHIWDGIKRGRTVWAGDLHPAGAALAAACGSHPALAASLDQLRDRYSPAEWMNGIPTYSLWWVLTHAALYQREGDLAYLRDQIPYLRDLLTTIDAGLDPDGCETFSGWRYLDWSTTKDPDAVFAGTQALVVWAGWAADWIGEWVGDPSLRDQAKGLLKRAMECPAVATACKAAQALRVCAGVADTKATNRDILAPEPTSGLTPFLGYYVLEARAMAGDHAGALDLIRTYWGAMVNLGATTFWEDFELDWATGSGRIDAVNPPGLRDLHAGLGRNRRRGHGLSLCHAWSAGPTAWLSRHVLGVGPAEPGFAAALIRPSLGDLDFAEGAVPTPHGLIHVRHEKQADGSTRTEVDAPAGVEVKR